MVFERVRIHITVATATCLLALLVPPLLLADFLLLVQEGLSRQFDLTLQSPILIFEPINVGLCTLHIRLLERQLRLRLILRRVQVFRDELCIEGVDHLLLLGLVDREIERAIMDRVFHDRLRCEADVETWLIQCSLR